MDGLTLKASLRAAEMCDLAVFSKPVKRRSFPDSDVSRFTFHEQRERPLRGGKDMREMGAGSITKWQLYPLRLLALIIHDGSSRNC